MSVLDKLKKAGAFVRTGWRSSAADSYAQYRRGREHERKQAERGREDAERSAERERKTAERGREYEERYAAERAAAEPHPESPPTDRAKPE